MMKKIIGLILFIILYSNVYSIEIYRTNVYPGVVNHITTSYSYGTFKLNVMESEYRTLKINRRLTSNNSLTVYEYTYNGEGLLSTFKERFNVDGGDFKTSADYVYEYKENLLISVKENDREIYFPTSNPNNALYFLSIIGSRDELLFNYEYNRNGEVISITQNDVNGTTYFFKNNLLSSVESIGTSDQRLNGLYSYNENNELSRYRLQYSEGRGIYLKETKYDFIYDEKGIINKYFFEKSGKGQPFKRISCEFEYLLNDDETLNIIFALDENGETVRKAEYEYESKNNYSVNIYDELNRMIVSYEVEQQ